MLEHLVVPVCDMPQPTHVAGVSLPVRNAKPFHWKETHDRCQVVGTKDPHAGISDTRRKLAIRCACRDDAVRVDDRLVHLRTDLSVPLLCQRDWTPPGATRASGLPMPPIAESAHSTHFCRQRHPAAWCTHRFPTN